jgi:hypothetical protein
MSATDTTYDDDTQEPQAPPPEDPYEYYRPRPNLQVWLILGGIAFVVAVSVLFIYQAGDNKTILTMEPMQPAVFANPAPAVATGRGGGGCPQPGMCGAQPVAFANQAPAVATGCGGGAAHSRECAGRSRLRLAVNVAPVAASTIRPAGETQAVEDGLRPLRWRRPRCWSSHSSPSGSGCRTLPRRTPPPNRPTAIGAGAMQCLFVPTVMRLCCPLTNHCSTAHNAAQSHPHRVPIVAQG